MIGGLREFLTISADFTERTAARVLATHRGTACRLEAAWIGATGGVTIDRSDLGGGSLSPDSEAIGGAP